MSGPQILERAHLNRFDKIDRLGMSPTLVHFDVLATCPDGDIRTVRMLAFLMWLSATWE
jgi:hypothetical protein